MKLEIKELNQMKTEKERDESRLAALEQTKENIAKYSDYEEKLKELYTRIVPDLDNCTNQDKKDAYRYLETCTSKQPRKARISRVIFSLS